MNHAAQADSGSRHKRSAVRAALALLFAATVAAGCDAGPTDPVVKVAAVIETAPVADAEDAADDPAIWIDAADPAASVIIGTNKKRGLVLYDLSGAMIGENPDGDMNNVDLRQGVAIGGQAMDIVAATNRTSNTIAVYVFDSVQRRLVPAAAPIPSGMADVYGFCMYRSAKDGAVYLFANSKDGDVTQWRVEAGRDEPLAASKVRNFKVGSQPEGCAADDASGQFYIGEEDVALWRVGAEPGDPFTPVAVDRAGGEGHLTADIEGVTIIAGPGRGWLVVSSQGANRYVVYDRLPPNAYVGTFEIADGNIDGTSDTDGIDGTATPLGSAFPGGIFIAQDGTNKNSDGSTANQNFKLVRWDDIVAALGLH